MLKIQADPTFTSKVTIPTPNGPVDIKVEFKHRDTDELASFIKEEQERGRSNEDAILDLAVNWHGVDGEFNRENIAKVCKQYHQAAGAICETYFTELTQARAKNSVR
jgi:hypothetical protein